MCDKLLENLCIPKFTCADTNPLFGKETECALYVKHERYDECKYYSLGACTSAVAQVNAMTILMKNMGVTREVDS